MEGGKFIFKKKAPCMNEHRKHHRRQLGDTPQVSVKDEGRQHSRFYVYMQIGKLNNARTTVLMLHHKYAIHNTQLKFLLPIYFKKILLDTTERHLDIRAPSKSQKKKGHTKNFRKSRLCRDLYLPTNRLMSPFRFST